MRVNNKNVDTNNRALNKLALKILDGIRSLVVDYGFLFTSEELAMLKDYEVLSDNISKAEEELKPYVFRSWEYEKNNGNYFISWLKDDNVSLNKTVISSTFGNVDSFCESVVGVAYDVNYEAFIGACEKDAATVVEDASKKSIYTIKELDNNRIVNSYNLATPIITPKQATSCSDNTYLSKHNEIILDGRYAIPVKVICTDERYNDVAERVASIYNIPFESKRRI